jgi:hypothetical protein
MPAWIDVERWDLPALEEAWRTARPFPHVILDDLISSARMAEILGALEGEPCSLIHDEIFECMASGTTLIEPVLASFQAALGGADALSAVRRITGKDVGRVEMRAFAYEAGHYLLPHSDHQREVGRAVAYAFYLDSPEPPEGGELELFACVVERGEVVSAETARLIPPTPNRLVLFDVGDASLHQVREVTRGSRLSLSGWFYP